MVENWLTATDGRRPGVARAVRLVVVLVQPAMTLANATILVDQAAISLALSNIRRTSTSARSVAMGAERELLPFRPVCSCFRAGRCGTTRLV
jgi:hypothetical protein